MHLYFLNYFILIIVFFITFTNTANAIVEEVLVSKILDDNDKIIITRKNGESYLIEKGVGCISLWRYENKKILIHSPGLFLGIGSKIILDGNQECRIWNSEYIASKDKTSKLKSDCYKSSMMSPVPFHGNGGELIMLDDGSIWQEISYQYLYLYEYYPSVTICPSKGKMILEDNVFDIIRVR